MIELLLLFLTLCIIALTTFTRFTPQNGEKNLRRKKFWKNVEAKRIALCKEAKINRRFEPQNFTALPFYTKIMTHLKNNVSDVVIDKAEGLIALYLAISDCTTKQQFVSVCTLYAKTLTNKSLVGHVTKLADELFTMTPQDSGKPEWLTLMTQGLTDWKLIVANPAFKKVSRIISYLVTLGIFGDVNIKIKDVTVFSIGAQERQVTAVDLIDAVVETVTFFAEGAYQCFTEGSLKPLLFSTNEVAKVETRYVEMLSLWEYARNGNLRRFVDMDEAEFDSKLKTLVADLESMYKSAPNGIEKKILGDRWKEMSKILTEFESSRVRGGLRKSPFTFKVYGTSGVGKSSFTDTVLMTLLKANGYPAEDDYIITLNPDDKHMSNMRSYVTGIKIDDYGNTKLDFVELSPTDWIITICNNIKRYAVMADLANKGKISIEPAVVSITTNVEGLHASKLSYEPESIVRRAHSHVELKVRPEFCIDGTLKLDPLKVFEKYGDSKEIQDIWLVTVRDYQLDNGGQSVTFIDRPGYTDVSIFKYLELVLAESAKHFKVQDAVVAQQTELAAKIPWCEECNRPTQVCNCCEPQFGNRIASVVHDQADKWNTTLTRTTLTLTTKAEDIAVDKLLSSLRWFETSKFAKWTNYVPDSLIEHEYVKALIMFTHEDMIAQSVTFYLKRWVTYAFFAAVIIWKLFGLYCAYGFTTMAFAYFMISYASIVEHVKSAYYERLKKERDLMPTLFKSIREQHMKYVCGAIAGFSLIWMACKTVKALRNVVSVQGELDPKSISEIKARDEVKNPWAGVVAKALDVNPGTGDLARFESRLKKSLWFIEVGDKHCDALCIATGKFLLPHHMMPEEPTVATLTRAGQVIKFVLDPKTVFDMNPRDLVLCHVPNCPPSKDILHLFAGDLERRSVPACLFYVDKATDVTTSALMWGPTPVANNGARTAPGAIYDLEFTTFGGLCMAPIVSNSVSKCILGVHLGGRSGERTGCAHSITRGDLIEALVGLKKLTYLHLSMPEETDINEQQFGRKVASGGTLHKKSPINWVPDDAAVVCYGNINGRATASSSVISTPISDTVEQVCGVPNKWGPPRFNDPVERADGSIDNQRWKPWSASLQVSCNPSIGFATSDVMRAADDYLLDLKEVFERDSKYWKEDLRPLTDIETVSGRDGVRFIDAMPSGTSMGFPISGPKNKYLIDLEPTDEQACPRTFTPEIMDAYHKALDDLAKGKSINAIFGSSLKDEPTPVNKEKVRVFQAAPIVLQMVLRKYYLPIARFMSMYPLLSECVAGVNAHGDNWNELAEHMKHFGDDRILAGDYSKYDLRMPAQLTQSAFAILLQIARWSGNYTPRELRIMETVASEVTCPLVAFNGDLMRFLGTNPSGQNLTVYINSIVNSLQLRLGFYHVYPTQESMGAPGVALRNELGRDVRFRDVCKVAIYGDDVKGSVKPGFDAYNHIAYANFLKENDMIFTMPDKESEPTPYMNDEDADFLKRKNRYDEDLDAIVGMLDENSIFKSLHSILKSKVETPMEVACTNIDGALQEWFYHGRDVYEKRRSEMKRVADEHAVAFMCRTLNDTFDDKVEQWKAKYGN